MWAEAAEGSEVARAEIAALVQGIKDLDKSVAEATETRKEESTEYTETKAGNNAAKQLLEVGARGTGEVRVFVAV